MKFASFDEIAKRTAARYFDVQFWLLAIQYWSHSCQNVVKVTKAHHAKNHSKHWQYLPLHSNILKASIQASHFQEQSTFYITLFHHPFQFTLCLVASYFTHVDCISKVRVRGKSTRIFFFSWLVVHQFSNFNCWYCHFTPLKHETPPFCIYTLCGKDKYCILHCSISEIEHIQLYCIHLISNQVYPVSNVCLALLSIFCLFVPFCISMQALWIINDLLLYSFRKYRLTYSHCNTALRNVYQVTLFGLKD